MHIIPISFRRLLGYRGCFVNKVVKCSFAGTHGKMADRRRHKTELY